MKVDVELVVAVFRRMIEENGSTIEVILDSGELFEIKASDINRVSVELTSGLSQERNVIRFMSESWHEKAGSPRRPRKGDRIVVGGTRYAVDTARPAQFQDTVFGYVVTLRA